MAPSEVAATARFASLMRGTLSRWQTRAGPCHAGKTFQRKRLSHWSSFSSCYTSLVNSASLCASSSSATHASSPTTAIRVDRTCASLRMSSPRTLPCGGTFGIFLEYFLSAPPPALKPWPSNHRCSD
eukprot:7386219-Prymnesium_polylepis.1